MNKRKLIIASIAIAGAILTLTCVIWSRAEAKVSYQGTTLTEWIVPFCIQTGTNFNIPGGPNDFQKLEPVRHAIREIGTNGLPILIRLVDKPESSFHRQLRIILSKQSLTTFRLEDPRVRRVRAVRALSILGPLAKPAIPTMVSQLNDSMVAEHSVYALSGMGEDGVRALVDAYPHIIGSGRMVAGMVLTSPASMYRGENHTETNAISLDLTVEGLQCVLSGPSSPFQMQAIPRLRMLAERNPHAFAVLLGLAKQGNGVNRSMAIRTLGSMRSHADQLMPILDSFENDTDPLVRTAARSALDTLQSGRTDGPVKLWFPGGTNRNYY